MVAAMADGVARQMRDGVAKGEQAPAVMLRDTLHTRAAPALFTHFFSAICSHISSGRAQAKGLVSVALRCPPESYTGVLELEKSGLKPGHWLQIVDCYTDPLGWNELLDRGREEDFLQTGVSTMCHDISNLNALLSTILKSGRAAVNQDRNGKFVVLIDSVLTATCLVTRHNICDVCPHYNTDYFQLKMSVLLRYHPLSALTSFISVLRSHEQVSALMWLVHAELHEERVVTGLEYLTTTVVHLEPQMHLPSLSKVVNLRHGRIRIRTKKRTGRVSEKTEEFQIELAGVSFNPIALMREMGTPVVTKINIPKVQFNMELSKKEQEDRAKVILPFEHQGDGKEMHIYDGRPEYFLSAIDKLGVSKSSSKHIETGESGSVNPSEIGEIHYLRDSDDEHPDSDEDPDDDLDI